MTRPDWGWGAQPQSGRVMGITKIRGEKLGDMVGWGYRIILAEHHGAFLQTKL